MRPKFDTKVAHLFNRFRHLLMKSFELLHIRELLVDILSFLCFRLYVMFNDLLVPENRELLLDIWLLLVSYVKLMQSSMDVPHHRKQIVGETDVQVGTLNELVQGIIE